MALIGSIATVRAQACPKEQFAAAFAYLDEVFRTDSPAAARIRATAVGVTERIELAGGAFALEQVYRTKARAEGFFESHRKFIDVQVIVEGEEAMELVDVSRAVVKTAYQAERDLIVYEDASGATVLQLRAGEAAIFHPADIHMPGLGGSATGGIVRKTVIKVPVAAA
jgi:YhcH/YjgK/YiaL family protein